MWEAAQSDHEDAWDTRRDTTQSQARAGTTARDHPARSFLASDGPGAPQIPPPLPRRPLRRRSRCRRGCCCCRWRWCCRLRTGQSRRCCRCQSRRRCSRKRPLPFQGSRCRCPRCTPKPLGKRSCKNRQNQNSHLSCCQRFREGRGRLGLAVGCRRRGGGWWVGEGQDGFRVRSRFGGRIGSAHR